MVVVIAKRFHDTIIRLFASGWCNVCQLSFHCWRWNYRIRSQYLLQVVSCWDLEKRKKTPQVCRWFTVDLNSKPLMKSSVLFKHGEKNLSTANAAVMLAGWWMCPVFWDVRLSSEHSLYQRNAASFGQCFKIMRWILARSTKFAL